VPLQRSGNGKRPTPDLPPPGCAARSGFFNLSAPCSPRNRHGLVSCRWHSWGFPFRAFPPPAAVTPFDARCLPDLTSRFPPWSAQQAALPIASPAWRPSRLCSTSESVRAWPDVSPNQPVAALLGFGPSKGLPRLAMAPPSRLLLSRTSARVPRSRRTVSPSPGAPEHHSTRRVACLSLLPQKKLETAVLPGVHSLFTLHILSKLARPWLMVSPRVPEYVTASWRTFFRLRSLLPEQDVKNASGSVAFAFRLLTSGLLARSLLARRPFSSLSCQFSTSLLEVPTS
jgi:hypothetical protein